MPKKYRGKLDSQGDPRRSRIYASRRTSRQINREVGFFVGEYKTVSLRELSSRRIRRIKGTSSERGRNRIEPIFPTRDNKAYVLCGKVFIISLSSETVEMVRMTNESASPKAAKVSFSERTSAKKQGRKNGRQRGKSTERERATTEGWKRQH